MSSPLRPAVPVLLCVFFLTLTLGWKSLRADGDVVHGDPVPDGRGSWSIVEEGDGERGPDGQALRGAVLAGSLKQLVKVLESTKGWNPPRGPRQQELGPSPPLDKRDFQGGQLQKARRLPRSGGSDLASFLRKRR